MGPVIFTALPAVSLQAILMPTNKMIRPMTPWAGLARSRNGDANPIAVRTPSAFRGLIVGLAAVAGSLARAFC